MRIGTIATLAVSFALAACGKSVDTEIVADTEKDVLVAEAFIDSFYSFDPIPLQTVLLNAGESAPAIFFYQGWAKGGNYEVVNRMPCVNQGPAIVSCSITVKDDLIGALGIDFNVTDTFEMAFADGNIISVETSSDDPQAYHDARDWVRKRRPELIDEPCRGYFDGGPTPGKCVQAMVQGYREFVASGEFSETQ